MLAHGRMLTRILQPMLQYPRHVDRICTPRIIAQYSTSQHAVYQENGDNSQFDHNKAMMNRIMLKLMHDNHAPASYTCTTLLIRLFFRSTSSVKDFVDWYYAHSGALISDNRKFPVLDVLVSFSTRGKFDHCVEFLEICKSRQIHVKYSEIDVLLWQLVIYEQYKLVLSILDDYPSLSPGASTCKMEAYIGLYQYQKALDFAEDILNTRPKSIRNPRFQKLYVVARKQCDRRSALEYASNSKLK